MADITITAGNVAPTGTYTKKLAQFGEAVTGGQVTYLKSADSKYWKAQCDGTAEEAGSNELGIVLCASASANQFGAILTGGTITIGGTVVAGKAYYVSAAAGGICPEADLVTGNYTSQVGIATTSAILNISFNATGVARA